MSSRPSQVFLAVGTVAAGVYFLLPSVPQSFAYDVFGLACVGAIAIGVRRYRPAHPEETREQADLLRDMQCDMAQGFHFAKPMDQQAIDQFLAQRAPRFAGHPHS